MNNHSLRQKAQSLRDRIAKHERDLIEYERRGGDVSSVERELRAFTTELAETLEQLNNTTFKPCNSPRCEGAERMFVNNRCSDCGLNDW